MSAGFLENYVTRRTQEHGASFIFTDNVRARPRDREPSHKRVIIRFRLDKIHGDTQYKNIVRAHASVENTTNY